MTRAIDGSRSQHPDGAFHPRLEALRGLAALVVAAFHSSQAFWAPGKQLLTVPYHSDAFWRVVGQIEFALLNGIGAVNMFFVLSGFVLAASVERGPPQIGAAAYRFVMARVFRLFPAIWLTIALCTAIYLVTGPNVVTGGHLDVTRVVRNMMLLDANMNGVMWSLQIEVLAIPLIFVTGMLGKRWGIAPVYLVAAILLVLSFHGPWTRGYDPTGQYLLASFNPLLCFGLGMLASYAGPSVRWLKKHQIAVVFFVALCVFFCAYPMIGNRLSSINLKEYRWINILEAFAAATIVMIVAYREDATFAKPLDWPILRFYGRISYSFYLFHFLTVVVIWAIPSQISVVLQWGVPDPVVAIALGLVTIAIITPLAWLSWRTIEVPTIALGRSLVGRRKILSPA
jgi:peptidoglycan/LPS O-acetylase OafA/YrhL